MRNINKIINKVKVFKTGSYAIGLNRLVNTVEDELQLKRELNEI